jgi:Xaa-Pro dipeptidase
MGRPAAKSGDPVRDRIVDAMVAEDLDAVVATSPENVTYASGAAIPSQTIVRSRVAAAVVPREGSAALVVVALERDLAIERSRLEEVVPYTEFADDPIQVVAHELRSRGIADGRIGVEFDYLSVDEHRRLREAAPGATIVPVDRMLERLRMIKTAPELDALHAIGRVADRIVGEACAAVGPGATERQLGNVVAELYADGGGDRLTMLVVGSGPRSAHPNAPPTSRRMNEGELVRIDVIGSAGGYYSDVARTAVMGEPSQRQREIYDLLMDVHRRTLAGLRPGTPTSEPYRLYRDAMIEAGLPPYHFVGHGLGISLHEEPFLSERGETLLEEGMVMCVEPLTFVSGEFGVQIEDEVVITASGHELITQAGDMPRIGG